MTVETPARSERTAGILFAASAYLMWGFLPLYFLLLEPTGPWEIVSWRVLFSLVFCFLLLTVMRGWRRIVAIVRQPRILGWTALAGLLIYVNWQTFLIGTLSGNVVETALGYFINPIATMLLGVFVLRERLRPLQWAAVGIAAIAVVVIVIGYGHMPWIALILAASFAIYGLIKKQIGSTVDAVSGLTLESFWLVPIAGVQLTIVGATTGITLGSSGAGHAVLLVLSGVVTALPLLLFAAGTRRVPLSVVGMLQFIAPILQFLLGVFVEGEPMPIERWAGFIVVWLAVAVFVADILLSARRARR